MIEIVHPFYFYFILSLSLRISFGQNSFPESFVFVHVCVLNNFSVQESINFILNCFIFFSFIFLFFFVFSFSLASVSIIKDPLFCYIVLLLFFFFTLAFSFFSILFFALLIVFKMNKRHSSPHVFYRFECRFFLFHCCDSLYVIPNVFFPVAFSLFFFHHLILKIGRKKIISFWTQTNIDTYTILRM